MTIKYFGNGNVNCKLDGTEDMNESFLINLIWTLEGEGFYNLASIESPFDGGDDGYVYLHPEENLVYDVFDEALEVFWMGKVLKLYARQPNEEEQTIINNIMYNDIVQ